MVKCQNCGHENDIDASYCENCGSKMEGYSSLNTNNDGMNQTTKILIAVIVVLVIGVGIAGGVLLKSSQQTNTNQNTANVTTSSQVSNNSGFPVTDTSNLAVEISKYNGNIQSVSYGAVTLDKNQCLYILARAIVMINNGEQGNIPIKSYGSAPNPYGTVTSATIDRADYVNIASRTYKWMDKNGQAPNNVGISNPGQPDLAPSSALNLFSKALSEYKSTGQLPATVTIP